MLNKNKIYALIFSVTALIYSQPSFALRCMIVGGNGGLISNGQRGNLYQSGQNQQPETIGVSGGQQVINIPNNVTVYPDTPVNSVIWRGRSQTIHLQCYKSVADGWWFMSKPEDIFIYPGNTENPYHVPTINGLRVGLNINGKNYYSGMDLQLPLNTGVRVPACNNRSLWWGNNCPIIPLTLTYYPILMKGPGKYTPINWNAATRNEPERTSGNQYPLFQVDGGGGYNGYYKNFHVMLGNMSAIKAGKCNANITIPNVNVNFHDIAANRLEDNKIISKLFNITVKQTKFSNCPISFSAYITTSTPSNTSYVPLFNSNNQIIHNLHIKLEHNGHPITIGTPFLTDAPIKLHPGVSSVNIPFNANLSETGNQLLPIGRFHGAAVFHIIYN